MGCAELAGLDPRTATEIGEVLLGRAPGAPSADEITVYKAMGHVVEDIVAAELVYAAAVSSGTGSHISSLDPLTTRVCTGKVFTGTDDARPAPHSPPSPRAAASASRG